MRVLMVLLALCVPVLARNGGDPDKYKDVPANVRAWFKGVRSPFGIPCCDIADGYRVDWERRDDGIWVFIGGDWRLVPEEAVVHDAGNPTGDAVVWYVKVEGPEGYHIRCFVSGPEQ